MRPFGLRQLGLINRIARLPIWRLFWRADSTLPTADSTLTTLDKL